MTNLRTIFTSPVFWLTLITGGIFASIWAVHITRTGDAHYFEAYVTPAEDILPNMAGEYADIRECILKTGSEHLSNVRFSDLTFVLTPDLVPGYVSYSPHPTLGAFDNRTNRIYIWEKRRYNLNLIRHELTHAAVSPFGGHPEVWFNETCNNLI